MNNNKKLCMIGERIKKERETQGMTLEQLAQALNTTRQSVSKWEKGLGTLDLDSVLRMCDLFECEIGYLTCEYDCKKKDISDVQSKIHLSEEAIVSLIKYCESEDQILFDIVSYLFSASSDDSLFNFYDSLIYNLLSIFEMKIIANNTKDVNTFEALNLLKDASNEEKYNHFMEIYSRRKNGRIELTMDSCINMEIDNMLNDFKRYIEYTLDLMVGTVHEPHFRFLEDFFGKQSEAIKAYNRDTFLQKKLLQEIKGKLEKQIEDSLIEEYNAIKRYKEDS